MKVLKVNPEKPEIEIIKKATDILKLGGIVVYPTETLYGIGANILDTQALYRVFEIKGRDFTKPISMAFRNLDQAKKFVDVTPSAEKLAKKFLPGPLTLILPAKFTMDEALGGSNIGIRIPDHPVAQMLLEQVKFPLSATSANLSGGKNPVEAKDAAEQIGDSIDLILDAGKCKYAGPSTVLDATSGEIRIVRKGVIKKEELEKFT